MSERIVDGQIVDPYQIGDGPLTQEQLIYKENILEHYRRPRNKRAIENATARLRENNPFCGDVVEVFLVLEHGVVKEVSFQGNGCAISQASMSMLTGRMKGMPVEGILALDQQDVLEMLGIPIGIVRMKCAMLGLRTTQKAIKGVMHEQA